MFDSGCQMAERMEDNEGENGKKGELEAKPTTITEKTYKIGKHFPFKIVNA
jgi:hypothetical protein